MTKTDKSKIIAETHKLLDRAEKILDEMVAHIIKNGGRMANTEWREINVDGEVSIVRPAQMQDDLIKAVRARAERFHRECKLMDADMAKVMSDNTIELLM